MRIKEFLALPAIRESVKRAGINQWKAKCPAHEDDNPSLSIKESEDRKRILLCCHAHCEPAAICHALGIGLKDLFLSGGRQGKARSHGRMVACYDYHDADGVLLYQSVRYEDKHFNCRRPGKGPDAWVWNLKDTPRVLYRLPAVLQAKPKDWVFVVEGEKDADNLVGLGLVATTNPGGAGKWRASYNESLRGRRVAIIPDNDEAGKKHAVQVGNALSGIAADVRVVTLSGLPDKGDVSDWLAAGGTKKKLLGLAEGTEAYQPQELATRTDAESDENDSSSGPGPILASICEHLELFHDEFGKAWARAPVGGHYENLCLKSQAFNTWLAGRYYAECGKAVTETARNAQVAALEGHAQFASPERSVSVRLAACEDKLYIDLGDPEWRVIEIAKGGWHIRTEGPVRFRRPKGLKALPEPVHGDACKAIASLRSFVNVTNDQDWVMLLAWTLGVFSPEGPYPILLVMGEQGSAKSTTCRFIQQLTDPSMAQLRNLPHSEQDLQLAARNSRVLGFDNVSRIKQWLSDAFCRLSTSGTHTTRELYSNDEESILAAYCPVLLNGITEAVTRSDLIDRTIRINLPPIPDERRLTERVLFARFEQAKPRIFGALLDAVALAWRDFADLTLADPPRMADFATWAAAGLPALGISAGDFLAAYAENRSALNEAALEGSPLAEAVEALMKERFEWSGRSVDLLQALGELPESETWRNQPAWPQSPRGVSGQLRRLITNLRRVGIEIGFHRASDKKHGRIIRIETVPIQPSEPSEPSDGL